MPIRTPLRAIALRTKMWKFWVCPSNFALVDVTPGLYKNRRNRERSYIRTLLSSPPEANIDGLVGLHDIAVQQPFLWPGSFSMSCPVSLCQM
jgi:hypothetical protein